jgi:hypothetical protein
MSPLRCLTREILDLGYNIQPTRIGAMKENLSMLIAMKLTHLYYKSMLL